MTTEHLESLPGIRAGPPEVIARLEKGEAVDPGDYYFRIAPLLETGAARYSWLNNVVAIGSHGTAYTA